MISCSIEVALSLLDLLFNSVRIGVGRTIILEAVFDMCMSLVHLVTDNMLKKQVER